MSELTIYILMSVWYTILVRQRRPGGDETAARYERREDMNEMTNAEFDAFLETLAQLIEAKAKTVEEAAALVRDKKSK